MRGCGGRLYNVGLIHYKIEYPPAPHQPIHPGPFARRARAQRVYIVVFCICAIGAKRQLLRARNLKLVIYQNTNHCFANRRACISTQLTGVCVALIVICSLNFARSRSLKGSSFNFHDPKENKTNKKKRVNPIEILTLNYSAASVCNVHIYSRTLRAVLKDSFMVIGANYACSERASFFFRVYMRRSALKWFLLLNRMFAIVTICPARILYECVYNSNMGN